MIQGTTSDAGKSTLVAGLCRVYKNRNIIVAPFKPQNMALNSAVTIDGGEIGRAQAVQAQAAMLEPHTDMNPVLIKPASDTGAQIIIHGHALSEMDAAHFHHYKPTAMKAVLESYKRLTEQYQLILVEGAGSPAEINLRQGDIANMGFAEEVDCPVILVADIDRGGVFAHLVGTLELLSPSERNRIKGFVINRFRGDIKLLEPGLEWLEKYTGIPVLGVLPYIHGFHLEAEDALNIEQVKSDSKLKVIVPALPRISNHTDFDPLRLHPNINFEFIAPDQSPPPSDLIILPGSKNVREDLKWLKQQGWVDHIQHHVRYGGKLIGICGGLQMLGTKIHDPHGVEGSSGESNGLEFLQYETTLEEQKTLLNVSGRLNLDNAKVTGYEIHQGQTIGPALDNPAIILDTGTDGAISEDQQILATYLHGLFEQPEAFNAIIKWAGCSEINSVDYHALKESEIERLADTLERHMDMNRLNKIMQLDL